jgi:two-component system KDP operon response regulator KdpE
MNHILVVDDDRQFRETLIKALRNQGYRATGIDDPDALVPNMKIHQPDVVLLDMMFDSDKSGLDACQQLRRQSTVPVLIISVLDDETTKVKVLDAGADDYLSKPFGVEELLARIRAIERRANATVGTLTPIITLGDLVIDFEARLVTLRGTNIRLTRKEYMLFKLLIDARGKLVTYDKIIAELWPGETTMTYRNIRAMVAQLRHKLEEDLSNPKYILSEGNIGYRLNLPDA